MGDIFRQADIEQAIVALEEFDKQGSLPDELERDLEGSTTADPLEILGQVLEHESTYSSHCKSTTPDRTTVARFGASETSENRG